MYQKALEFITKKHKGQVRYNGNPFIIHPIRVSQEVNSELLKIIALLHDVVEDTDATFEDLKEFGDEVVNAVDAITRRKGESNFDYIKRVKKNENAIKVKLADIADNLADSPSDKAIKKSVLFLNELID